jgi:RNA polymerase sigma-70 factor (ECF subfamily)
MTKPDTGSGEMLASATAARSQPTTVRADAEERDFVRVFSRELSFVGRSLSLLGVRTSDLEDQCQEVFVVVHRRLPEFEGRSSVRRWLHQICRRVAANYRRKRARHEHETVSDERPLVSPATQEGDVASRDAWQKLLGLLEGLDEDQRTIFMLYEIEGMSMREVCEVVGCPVQTGYSRHKRARTSLLERAQGLGLKEEG